MIIYYICDKTFEGLLTAVYDAYYNSEKPDKILPKDNAQIEFFVKKIKIQTDNEKAEKVMKALKDKVSSHALKKVFYVFISELDNSYTIAYNYIKLAFKMGKEVDSNLSNTDVLAIDSIYRKVAREIHLMLGLTRFREISQNVLYAPIDVEYNILTILSSHFAERLQYERWIIHDKKRSIASFYSDNVFNIVQVDKELNKRLYNEKELIYQDLWKRYFKSTAIKGRLNPKLQMNFMPKKYWSNLIEK
ncbi:TIGR03915 family putative DNA repair protein [Clostridiaceae bacterium M8S5]|nr:TIGR03915 family putative DNA repair protein [Clostridiaceae bacterium M8S5]